MIDGIMFTRLNEFILFMASVNFVVASEAKCWAPRLIKLMSGENWRQGVQGTRLSSYKLDKA